MVEVPVGTQKLERFTPLLGEEAVADTIQLAGTLRERLGSRVIWNINSTAAGGGVAEMLAVLLPYVRGAGIDARWLTIEGSAAFFRMTKRIHHALHGSRGDRSDLGTKERELFEATSTENAAEIAAVVRPNDVVILHDPQTAGLASHLIHAGALVMWRCHIGHDTSDPEVERGWNFLAPYLREVPAFIFSRRSYVPEQCDHGKAHIIPPSIDAFSPKNQELDDASVRAILTHVGLVDGPRGDGEPVFCREDGSPGRVDHLADIVRLGPAPAWETPLVVQVSRWDPLKDPIGVMLGFAEMVERDDPCGAELVLAGPNVHAVADDPEGAVVLDEVIDKWRELPHAVRQRIHIASLPMSDIEENAAIVNALQRHAAIVVQKSLREGFGLTVTEAMWKARPVVASAVGGIQDQVEDGVHGLLLKDPSDRAAFAAALRRLLDDPGYARRLGEKARQRVRQEFLGFHHLGKLARLLEELDRAHETAGRPVRNAAD